jgi:hypothetical protein
MIKREKGLNSTPAFLSSNLKGERGKIKKIRKLGKEVNIKRGKGELKGKRGKSTQ